MTSVDRWPPGISAQLSNQPSSHSAVAERTQAPAGSGGATVPLLSRWLAGPCTFGMTSSSSRLKGVTRAEGCG